MAGSSAALATLDERPLSPAQRYAAILVALGEFIDGYDLLVIGGALIFPAPALQSYAVPGRCARCLRLPRRHGRHADLRRHVR